MKFTESKRRTALKKRFETLDSIRGVAVVSMVLFHLMYDINELFTGNAAWSSQPLVHLWQRSICITFIIVSGFVWSYGKKHAIKRGLFLSAVGIAVTAVTLLFMPDAPIIFGVMSFFGCAVLLMIPFEKLLRYVNAYAGLALSLVLFLITENISYGSLTLFGQKLCTLPSMLYSSNLGVPFGFIPKGFFSSDYYPLLPWMFLYFFGYFLERAVAKSAFFEKIGHVKEPVFSFVGRHAVLIYILHQPICYVLCMLVFR